MLTIIEARTNLGLRPDPSGKVSGCDRAPTALLGAGLIDGLVARFGPTITAPAYVMDWTPGDGCRNATGVAGFSVELADAVEPELGRSFPVVLGGDCSVLIGEALALRRRGRCGLVFIDGHGDFRHPGTEPVVAAAGEDLAIVTGRGDERLVDLEGRGPLVDERDVIVLGIRSDDPYRLELEALGMPVRSVRRIVADSPASTASSAISHASGAGRDGFWIHLDVDVLDPADMPAVDSPAPGGLRLGQLADLLAPIVADERALGLDVCIYDPDLDPDGSAARALAATLRDVLAERAAPV